MFKFSWSILEGTEIRRDKDVWSQAWGIMTLICIGIAAILFIFGFNDLWPKFLVASVIPFIFMYISRVIFIEDHDPFQEIYEWLDNQTYDSKGKRKLGACPISFPDLRKSFPNIPYTKLKEIWKSMYDINKIHDIESMGTVISKED